MRFDPTADWPTGGPVDWPEGMLFLYGIPLKIFGVSDYHALEWGASLITVFIGVVTVILAYHIAKLFFEEAWMAKAVAWVTGLSPLLVRYSALGQVDHHHMEILWSLFALWLVLKQAKGDLSFRALALGAFGLSFGLLFSSSLLFVLGAYLLSTAWLSFSEKHRAPFIWASAGLCAGVFLIAGLRVFWANQEAISILQPSFFHLGSLAGLSLILLALMPGFGRTRLVFFILLGVGVWAFWPMLGASFERALNYVFSGRGVLQFVGEASPIFYHFDQFGLGFIWSNFGPLLFLLPLLPLAFVYFRRWSLMEQAFWIYFALLLIPGIAQKRFSALFFFSFVLASFWLLRFLLETGKFLDRRLQLSLKACWLGLLFLPVIHGGYPTGWDFVRRQDFALLEGSLQAWEISAEEAWTRLGEPEQVEEAFWVPTNWGHAIQYLTGYGVISNSYFHAGAMRRDQDLRRIREAEELETAILELRVRGVWLADEVPLFLAMLDARGLDTSTYRFKEGEAGAAQFRLDRLLEDFAWLRLLFGQDDFSDSSFKPLLEAVTQDHPQFSHFRLWSKAH